VVIVNVIQYLFGAEIYTFPDDIYGNLPPQLILVQPIAPWQFAQFRLLFFWFQQ
jgi:hypothetical protein